MRRRVKPRFWLFIIGITLAVFLASFAAMNHRYAQGSARLRQVIEQRDALQLQVNDMSDRLAFAKTDDYIIRIARDELGMLMPGEIRYVNGAR